MTEYTVERTGTTPLRFKGRVLTYVSGHREAAEGKKDKPQRWHTLILHELETGTDRFVLCIHYDSDWPNEVPVRHAVVCEGKAAVARALQAHDPTRSVQGYPVGAQFEGRQRHLLADVKRRYESAVSSLLAQADVTEEVQ